MCKALDELREFINKIEDEYKEAKGKYSIIEAKRQDILHIDFEMADDFEIESMSYEQVREKLEKNKELHEVSVERRKAKNEVLKLEKLKNDLESLLKEHELYSKTLDSRVENKVYNKKVEDNIEEKEIKRETLKQMFVAHGRIKCRDIEFHLIEYVGNDKVKCILRHVNTNGGRDGYDMQIINKNKLSFY